MADTVPDIEKRVQLACSAYTSEEMPSIQAAADAFDAPIWRVRRRLQGRPPKKPLGGKNKALNQAQEKALLMILRRLDHTGLSARVWMVTSLANAILQQAHTLDSEPPRVSPMWAPRFLRRHKAQFKVRSSQPLAILRKNAHNPSAIRDWYTDLFKTIDELGIQQADIYNFDHTGFRIGCGKRQRVVTERKSTTAKIYVPDPDTRDYITVVECISADGHAIQPQVIMQAELLLEKHFVSELDNNVLLSVSESGYSNDELSLDWVKHFEACTRKRLQGRYRLLLFDNFDSSETKPFIEYLINNDVIPFTLPAHTTHLLQPLDVVCFQPFKHYHAEAIDRTVRCGLDQFGKLEFLSALARIREDTFKYNTVLSAWRITGILPRNLDLVLDKLREAQAREYTPEQPESTNTESHTPSKLEQFIEQSTVLQQLLNSPYFAEVPAWLKQQFDSTLRGGITLAHYSAQAIDQLDASVAASTAKRARSNSNRRVKKGGSLTVEQGRDIIEKRRVNELEETERKLRTLQDREAKRLQKQADKAAKEAKKAERDAQRQRDTESRVTRMEQSTYRGFLPGSEIGREPTAFESMCSQFRF